MGLLGLLLGGSRAGFAQGQQAPVEVRVPQAPQPVTGSDGRVHLAYELHVTNFYPATDTLRLQQVTVLLDDSPLVLARFTGPQVNRLMAHPTLGSDSLGVPIAAGQRTVLFLWPTLPAGRAHPHWLRHQLTFITRKGERQRVDGVRTSVQEAAPLVLGAPLRAGPWLTSEGPGNHRAHHWGSVVAVNGQVTIPQRYAVDFFGLTAAGHAVRVTRDQLRNSTTRDWVGFGADVLAVAEGVVRDMRDGEPDHRPLAPLPAVTDLTERTLMGNFVVLEIAPRVFVHYAHLQPGSLAVKVGERVRRGAVLGRIGQSGNANAPHLHFQVSTAATFEESEGIPFVFERFACTGSVQVGAVLDQAVPVPHSKTLSKFSQHQLPLDGYMLVFP